MKLPPRPPRSENSQQLDTRKLNEFESLLHHAPVSYLILDPAGVILEANLAAARLLGKESHLLAGQPLRQFVFEADQEKFDQLLDQCRCKQEKVSLELRLNIPGAPSVDFLSSSFQPSASQEAVVQVIIHEYYTNGSGTVGKGTTEAEIQRLTRTLKALRRSSQAMMRAKDHAGYMNEVCKIVQEDCGHAMVWIGLAHYDDQKSIRPVAYAGFEEGYLETLRLTWDDTERGRGPTGSAIRTGKPHLCRNMLTDPRFAPWREEAVRRGYASSIALPLIGDAETFGAITIYSRETDPFSEDEVELLSGLAHDLAYGLASLRLRAAQDAAEQLLRESEERHRALFENMSEGFALHEIITDSHGSPFDYRFLEVNPAFVKLTGLRREDLLGKSVKEVLPDTEPVWIERYGRVALTGEPAHFENFSASLGRWYEVFAYRPAPLQFAVVFTDITQRKYAEDQRREIEEHVRRKLQSVLEPEGDLGMLELSDLIDVEAMQKLMDNFYAVSRFPMTIADMKARILVGVGWQEICTGFHRVHPETCQRCLESDTQLSAGVPGGEFRLYKCKNGLWDIATPIIVGGRQVGNIFSGQFFFDDEEIDRESFRSQARRYGFDEAEYLAALDRVPRLSRVAVDNGMAFLLKLADMLSRLGYSNATLARLVAERDRLTASLREERERLTESRLKYQSLIETTGDFIWEMDSHGRYTYCSPQMERLWGLKPEEMIGKTPFDVMPAESRKSAMELFAGFMRSPKAFSGVETAAIDSQGRLVHIETGGVPFFDKDGMLAGFRGISRDVTERKRLTESEERLKALMSRNPSLVFLKDESGRYVYLNEAYEEQIVHSKEWPGKTDFDFWPRESAELFRRNDLAVLKSGKMQQVLEDSVDRDGRRRCWLAYKFPFSDSKGITYLGGIGFDVTDRVRAEEEVLEQKQRLTLAMEVGRLVPYEYDLDNHRLEDIPRMMAAFGVGPSQTDGAEVDWGGMIFEDDRRAMQSLIGEATKTGKAFHCEFRLHHPDATIHWHEIYGTLLAGERGGHARLVGFLRDITESKRAAEALRESEHQIQEILESISDGFWAVDSQWRFIYMNKRAAENLGYKPSDLIGKSLWETFPDVEQSLHAVHYHKVMAERVPSRFEIEGVLTARAYAISVYPSGDGISVYWQDVTERKIAENKLKRSTERFALLSETASSLLASPNPQAVIDELCRKVMAQLDCDIFFNFLVDEEAQRLRLNACGGIAPEDLDKVQWLDFGSAICGYVARERRRAIVEDILHIPDDRTALVKSFGVQAYCCHPLMAGERVIGTLSFGSKRRSTFSADEVELMRVVADQVSVALERIRTEKARRESEERLQEALRVSRSFAFEWVPATDRVHRSLSCASLLGLTGSDAVEETGQKYFQRLNPADRERFVQTVSGLTPQAPQYETKYRLMRPDGGTTILEESGRGSFDSEGRLSRLIGITTDVTARERAEEALRELNAKLEQRVQDRTAALRKMTEALEAERKRFMDVLDVLPAYVILMSPDYHVPFANRFFEERFGKSLGRRCFEYLFNRSEPCETCESFRTLKENAPVKWEWTGPDGRTYDISDFPFTDTDGSKLILEMGIDITDRKRVEAELEKHRHHLEDLVKERTSQLSAANVLLQSEIAERKEAELALSESEERFRLAIQHSKLMAWQCDREMRFTWVYNSHFGMPGSELLDRTPADLGNEEGMKEFVAHCREVLAQGAGTRKTIKHVPPDGRERHFDQQVEALRDSRGHIIGLIGISLDVTERVQAEHRLHRSEESFRLMIGHSAEPMLLVDETGMIECISRKAADQMGFSETELIGTNVGRFLDWSAKLDLTMRLEDFLRHAPIPARAVLRIRTNHGSWCWIDVQAGFVNYGQRPEKYLLKFEVIDTEMKNSGQ